jgi:diguanylate cyclase (GGDEF)-like protein
VIPRGSSSHRIATASLIVVILLAGAAVVTIWRYEHAIGQSNNALLTRAENLRAEQAATFFWRERETMNEYLLTPSGALLGELANSYRGFNSTTARLGNTDPKERALVERSRAGNGVMLATFRSIRHVAGSGTAQQAAATQRLNSDEDEVLRPLDSLQAIYQTEVGTRRAEQASANAQAFLAVLLGAVLGLGATIGLSFYAMRLLAHMARRRESDRELEAAQAEFADVLQVTEAQDETFDLLKRRLERSIEGAQAVVLNRNNSKDRLEAGTGLPPNTDLAKRLECAEPRSCLAVRFARRHEEGSEREPLLSCRLCAGSSAHSTCEPLLVGGEVIGSALVLHPESLNEAERAVISVSVAHAGPVLANLRNLAIAEFRAATDALTGLPNSRSVHDTIKRMVAQASRSLSQLAALMLDLDHFKQINDTYGHGRGDEVLAAVGAALQASVRESDFVGRYGGEEFVILLPGTGRDDAAAVGEKIRAAVELIAVPGVSRLITVSAGIAIVPDDAGDSLALLRHADRRLYAAKANGRNQVVAGEEPDHAPGSPPAAHAGELAAAAKTRSS